MQVALESGGTCDTLTSQQQPSLLFHQTLAHLDLWLLRRQLQVIRAASATPLMLTAAMQMLGAAAAKAAALADDGYDMSAFEAACREAEQHLRSVAGERALTEARSFDLPATSEPPAALLGSCSLPCGVLPDAFAPHANESGLAAAKQRAARNLGSLSLLPGGAEVPFGQVLAFLVYVFVVGVGCASI